jgi:Protein of unknown function (DUF1638)
MVQQLEGESQIQTGERTMVIACATVIEEMMPHLPPAVKYEVLDFGLHVNPEALRSSLQEAIDRASETADRIILGYGLCSQAVVRLRANDCTLVVPKVDDCIAIFLGSGEAYREQARFAPGTYYLTKGWIEVGDTPFSEYERSIQRYGKERAEHIYKMMMGNYKRLALINTGQYELEKYRDYTRRTAEQFGLRYEEIEGSDTLVKKMLFGPWDDEFVVIEAGETFNLQQFLRLDEGAD